MKLQVAATIIALFPVLGWACAVYDFCLCTNSDGSFDEAATKTTCGHFGGNYLKFNDGRHYCGAGAASAGEAGGVVVDFSNCRFREVCQKNGATGDSDCWAKE